MTDSTKEDYLALYHGLAEVYGEPVWHQENHLPPMDELVVTILSQATSDLNRDKGYAGIKKHYTTAETGDVDWYKVMSVPTDELVEVIRSAGLANQKSPRIQEALRYIHNNTGALNIDFLATMELNAGINWLKEIKGIGRKTASIILLFSFEKAAFPVDTHVHRITGRVGLIGPKVTADKAHSILQNVGRPDTAYALHLNLIRHGREVCVARNPRCDQCNLTALCNYYQNPPTN